MPYKILFVCTGNICRSPTAEGVFRHKLQLQGLESHFMLDSAGTHNYHHGAAPDTRSIQVALKRGYDLSNLRARKVTGEDFGRFDLLLAMDRSHEEALRKLAPEPHQQKIKLFLEYAGHESLSDVPDPYYGNMRDFEEVIELIENSSDKILRRIRPEAISSGG